MPADDLLGRIDAAIDGRCACGCGQTLTPDGPSGWYASEDCQRRWQSQAAAERIIPPATMVADGRSATGEGGRTSAPSTEAATGLSADHSSSPAVIAKPAPAPCCDDCTYWRLTPVQRAHHHSRRAAYRTRLAQIFADRASDAGKKAQRALIVAMVSAVISLLFALIA